MLKLWKKISYLGVTNDQDFRLVRRIVVANRFGLLITLITGFFLVASVFRANAPVLPLLGMLAVAGGIWMLNAMEFTHLSRFITSVMPAVGVFILNISLKLGDPKLVDILHYATPRMIIIGSACLPFTMFTASERRFVWGTAAFIILLGFGYDAVHEFFGVHPAAFGINNAYYGIINEDMVVLSVIVLAASGFMFSIGDQYDQKASKLLNDALRQTESLRKNEEDLKKMLGELEVSHKKDEARRWVAKGVAELSAKFQTASESENIFEHWLSSLVKYLRVNQGGLFVAEEDADGQVTLKLTASYAFERKKFLKKTVSPGEGLLGQAYLEGQRIYLKRIPTEYLHITSGLGDAPPKVLVVMPIKTSHTTEAVLELASFHELEEEHFELLDALAEALAAFIANQKTNQRTRKLLQQAQTMSEELRANEEEMRQNLEELTATQEALARKEREYQQRIADLEATLAGREVEIHGRR